MKKLAKQVGSAKKQTMGSKLSYIKKNWQLYVFFLMPALLLTIIFKYLPMGGLLIAFEDYNVIKGVLGSPWVGLEYFQRFLSSPDFMNYLLNTLKLSIFGLLWSFPIPIILALLLNRIRKAGIKKKIQLLIYAPNFISVIVLCGMVRMFLSPVGPFILQAESGREQDGHPSCILQHYPMQARNWKRQPLWTVQIFCSRSGMWNFRQSRILS